MTASAPPDHAVPTVAGDDGAMSVAGVIPTAGSSRPRRSRFSFDPMAARRRRRLTLWCAVAWIVLVIAAAALADVLPLHDVNSFTDLDPRAPVGLRWPEPLGTDATGRSVLTRVVFGARQSLMVGVLSVAISAAIGSLIGLVAGYLRGRVDAVLSVVLDIMLAFPPLLLLLAIAAVGARDLPTVIAGLAFIGIAPFARLVRANTLTLGQREFVLAARNLGASRTRIMLRDILPNVLPAVSAVVFLVMAVNIIAEGSLSFLGLGIPPPAPSWGGMINEGRPWLRSSPQLVLVPSIALLLTVLAFRRIGEALRGEDRAR